MNQRPRRRISIPTLQLRPNIFRQRGRIRPQAERRAEALTCGTEKCSQRGERHIAARFNSREARLFNIVDFPKFDLAGK